MTPPAHPRHASPSSRALPIALPIGVAVTALGALWSLADVPPLPDPIPQPVPAAAQQLPAIDVAAAPVVDHCADAAVQSALDAGDDAAVIAAFGGGEAFRAAVAAKNAPCIALDDPRRLWLVVNKARPLEPASYAPAALAGTDLRTTTSAGQLRPDAAEAIGELGAALADAGAGRLGVNNGYRSFGLQQSNYANHVRTHGQVGADEVSARPGHSEHQTGLALDVVSCSGGCGGIREFAGTRESDWVAAHAWEHGFIVRYEEGRTDVTGYAPEPWHLRYIGEDLAAAYHAGGYTTLEEFFGLDPAPDYLP